MDTEADTQISGLPFEILEQVLALLPVPDLCRYRAVCKSWDRLITNPRFAARHNTASSSYIVMSSIWLDQSGREEGDQWCILDVCARRWYTVGYSKSHQFSSIPYKVMDGGLVCQNLHTSSEVTVIVHNPIASTPRVLPVVPAHATSRWPGGPALNLVVDAASATFKVILINQVIDRSNDPPVRVYESATNEWRVMRNPPWVNGRVNNILQSIMFQGWLYLLFMGIREGFDLRRYDAAADVWEMLAVPILIESKDIKLVVSDQRLFFAAWHREFYKLFEVKVPGMTRETVFEHSTARMVFQLGDYAVHCGFGDYHISMFGFGSCLLFMSNLTGKVVTFDVTTGMWDGDWPRNPAVNKLRSKHSWWFGEHMNLLLPSTRWWEF